MSQIFDVTNFWRSNVIPHRLLFHCLNKIDQCFPARGLWTSFGISRGQQFLTITPGSTIALRKTFSSQHCTLNMKSASKKRVFQTAGGPAILKGWENTALGGQQDFWEFLKVKLCFFT